MADVGGGLYDNADADALTQSSRGRSNDVPTDDVVVLLAGWGVKEGSWFKSWKRYYFVLRTSTPEEAASRPVGCTHLLLYYRSQDSAASGATPVGGMPIIRGRSTLGEIAKKVRGVYTPCLCVRTPGWRECLVAPAEESHRSEWVRALSTLKPPPNAAELRKTSIRNGKVKPVMLDASEEDTSADAAEAGATGISLHGIKDLRALVGKYNKEHPAARVITTADVANKVVKPATRRLDRGKQAFVHMSGGKHRGKPTFFVSHAWKADGVGLLDAIVTHGDEEVKRGRPVPVYYLDLACVDQHQVDQAAGNTSMPFVTLSKPFVEQIKACGEMLVIATPFSDPVVVHRAWCMYEAAVAKMHGVPATVVAPPCEEIALRNRVQADGGLVVIDVIKGIDSSKTETAAAVDLENIRDVIEAEVEGGFAEVDAIYTTMVRRWMLRLLTKLLRTFVTGSIEARSFADACGVIMRGVGDIMEHADVAVGYNNLGMVYDAHGDYAKALEYYEASLAILLNVLGDEHPDVAACYSNLGLANDALGNHAKAASYHERSLAIRLKALGPDHADVAASYNNLGAVYNAQGKHAKAIEFFDKSLSIELKVLGEGHLDVATSNSNLGMVYQAQGDYAKAIESFEKAMAIALGARGEEHADVAACYSTLGTLYQEQGDLAKAVEFHKKSLAIKLKVLDEEHPKVATSYNNLGAVYLAQFNDVEAVEHFEKSLAIRLKVLGDKHPDVAESYNNLGTVCYSQGDLDKAVKYFEKSLAVSRTALGAGHPRTKQVKANLDVVKSQGKGGSIRPKSMFGEETVRPRSMFSAELFDEL